jgi:hypothetical protein
MSERTAPAIEKLDLFAAVIPQLPEGATRDKIVEETDALRRAIAAFHMEAIRFRMHNVDRLLKAGGDDTSRRLFEDLRHTLETAGFHTRSHSAPS